VRVPAVLIPYPVATDNHQFHNARAFEATGAARLLEEKAATPAILIQLLSDLIEKPGVHAKMQEALAQWHAPNAAEQIVEAILAVVGAGAGKAAHVDCQSTSSSDGHRLERRGNPRASGSLQTGRLRTGQRTAQQTPVPAGRIG